MLFVQMNVPITKTEEGRLWIFGSDSFLKGLKRSGLMLQLIRNISQAAPLSGCGTNTELVTLIKENGKINADIRYDITWDLLLTTEVTRHCTVNPLTVCHATSVADLHLALIQYFGAGSS